MKKNDPIKRSQALVSFSKDHHFGLLLVWKIRQGINKKVSAERISKYVLFSFKEDLEKHFKDEEELLFSQLRVDDALRRRAEEEHREINKLVLSIDKDKNDESILNRFADTLEKHIRYEERELFNHMQNNIEAGILEKIAARLANDTKVIDLKWVDIFWINKK